MDPFRWGYVFLDFDLRVPYDSRLYLADQAVDMYLNEEKSRDITLEPCECQSGLEGRITTKGKYGMSGSFGGYIYNAEVDVSCGKAKLLFLVSEQTKDRDPLRANRN